jgi:hypothetical protein
MGTVLPGTAALAADRVALEWDAPAGCPAPEQVSRAIDTWLDKPGAGSAAVAVRVEAQVRRATEGWELDLTLTAPGGSEHQTLVAARCETLMQVVALKAALAVDPEALLRSVEPPAGPPASPVPTAVALRGALGAGLGTLPEASAFASLGGSVERPGWRLEIAGAAWLPQPARYPELPAVGARFLLFSGMLRGCLLPSMGRVDFPVCAGAELGLLQGIGFGVSQVRTSSQLWAAAVVGPAVRWPLGSSLSAWLGIDAVIGIARPAFHMRNLEELYRPDAVAARAWAGFEVRL